MKVYWLLEKLVVRLVAIGAELDSGKTSEE